MSIIGIVTVVILMILLCIRYGNKSESNNRKLIALKRRIDEAHYRYLRALRKGDVDLARQRGREYYLLLRGNETVSAMDEEEIEDLIDGYRKK